MNILIQLCISKSQASISRKHLEYTARGIFYIICTMCRKYSTQPKPLPHVYEVYSLFFWGKEWINMIEYTIFMNKIHRIFMFLHIFFVNMQHKKGVFFFLYPLFICLIHKNIKKYMKNHEYSKYSIWFQAHVICHLGLNFNKSKRRQETREILRQKYLRLCGSIFVTQAWVVTILFLFYI